VARGHYAPQAYHDFIGFEVSKELLDRAFQRTYGLTLKDLFHTLDLSLGTYRFTVSRMLPSVTKTAWELKKDEIVKQVPSATRKQFLYNIRRSSYEKEWGKTYERPGFGARFLALILRVLPRVGPLRGLSFKVPTPQTQRWFEDSFNAAVKRDRESFSRAQTGKAGVDNRDLDTGKPVSPGEYKLTDATYDKLLSKLAEKKFDAVTPELRANILDFYARMKSPDAHGIATQLAGLKSLVPAARVAQ
jgi:hypothetical protein